MEESSWRRTAPLVRLYVFFITFDDQSLLNCPLLRIALSSTQKVGPPLVCPDSLQVESIISPSGRRSSTGTNGFLWRRPSGGSGNEDPQIPRQRLQQQSP